MNTQQQSHSFARHAKGRNRREAQRKIQRRGKGEISVFPLFSLCNPLCASVVPAFMACIFLIFSDAAAQTEDVVPKWGASPTFPLTESNIYDVGTNVGIGASNPASKLHVNEGSVLFDGTTGSTPVSGAGTRLMWIPELAAFRAGEAVGSEWDAINIGYGSVALGKITLAKGEGAVAMGSGSFASGDGSLSIGTLCEASGANSVSLGLFSSATGTGSYSIGQRVAAISENSYVIGTGLLGYTLRNDISNSLMIGFNSNLPTLFVGPSDVPFSTGKVGIANSNPTSTLDVKGNASIGSSFSGGVSAPVNGLIVQGSTGIGEQTPKSKLSVKGNVAIGRGYSASAAAPHNGLIVEGRVGIGTNTPDANAKLHVEGGAFLVDGHVGNTPAVSAVPGPLMMWVPSKAAFRAGRVSGNEWIHDEIGDNSVAIGLGTKAKGNQSVALGHGSIATNTAAIAMGQGAQATGDRSVAIGHEAKATYEGSFAMGRKALSGGIFTHAIGYEAEAGGWFSYALGSGVRAVGFNTFSIGRDVNNITPNSLAIGFSSTPTLFVKDKKVGVGTINPSATLHIENQSALNGSHGLLITSNNNNAKAISVQNLTGGLENFLVYTDGRVYARKVRVTLDNFPDFVFDDDYPLKPLSEVEEYIKQNRHLPDIPSQSEVDADGLDLGEFNALLLQKIEELTLHTIEQQKQIDLLKAKIQ